MSLLRGTAISGNDEQTCTFSSEKLADIGEFAFCLEANSEYDNQ